MYFPIYYELLKYFKFVCETYTISLIFIPRTIVHHRARVRVHWSYRQDQPIHSIAYLREVNNIVVVEKSMGLVRH
jgi:hypothetical protein